MNILPINAASFNFIKVHNTVYTVFLYMLYCIWGPQVAILLSGHTEGAASRSQSESIPWFPDSRIPGTEN